MTEARLRAKARGDDPLVAWAQGWVSYDGRLHTLLAARTLDFAVLTSERLCLVTTGFLTRRPRRRIYDMGLERIVVEQINDANSAVLRITSAEHRPLLLELRTRGRGRRARAARFAQELVLHTRPPGTPAPESDEP
jgi:hypothetical protein